MPSWVFGHRARYIGAIQCEVALFVNFAEAYESVICAEGSVMDCCGQVAELLVG